MYDPPKKLPRRIEPNTIVPTIVALAKLAARASTPTVDIVIHQGRLGWRDHNKPHGHNPPLATFHTSELTCETLTFETYRKIRPIHSAVKTHNLNQEV